MSRTLMNARSRRTREALFAAARSILEGQGFEALTIVAVAKSAGVTRRAVYLHFPSRADLVGGLFDAVAAAEGLAESVARVWAAPDAGAALEEWAAHLARYHPRVLAVDRAVEHVWRSDPDAAKHRARVRRAKAANCRRLAEWLAREHRLAAPWTTRTAAQMLCALASSDVIESLLVDDHWTAKRLADHLGSLLRATFDDRGRAGRR